MLPRNQTFAKDQQSANAPKKPVHRYPNGDAYVTAKGRRQDAVLIEDTRNWKNKLAVVDLHLEKPSPAAFLALAKRELKIRFYAATSIKQYLTALRSFFRWSGCAPHETSRELVKNYLEYLVDADLAANTVAIHLSAIRTVFDKFCFLDVTLGLMTPRRPRRLPIVLSENEVARLLQAATSVRDTLLLGLMYATGMRVSEVVGVRFNDIDLDRNVIMIKQGKGNADRMVRLPQSYRRLFRDYIVQGSGDDFLFPAEGNRKNRHLSSRTAQRAMSPSCSIGKD